MRLQSSHGEIQQTKLIPPSKNSALVVRARLLSCALDAAGGRLLLINAAAGYGKTSVLAQVHQALRERGQHVAWLSLDEADNDHTRFLLHWVQALRKSGLRFGTAVVRLLASGGQPSPAVLRTSLLNALAALDQDLFLVLDDYHLITDAEVRQTLAAVLLAPLARVHLLIGSRSRNELPLNRLLALGQALEIDALQLAFSDTEARDFIEATSTRSLEPAQAARLREQTEGWAASLQLAVIALNAVDDVAGFLDAFSGESREVGEFLGEQVLSRLAPPLQQFLMESAILKRFNTGLVQAVTGRSDSRQLLDELEARNLFIFSLDDRRNWYRYHHLFADFLQRRLRDRHGSRWQTLHRRAADWLTANGLATEAIEHAFLAEDVERAGQLLDAACVELFASGQIHTLHRHAARLPRDMLRRLPRLQLELTWDYELQWRFAEARTALSDVRATLEQAQVGEGAVLDAAQMRFMRSKLAHRELMLDLLADHLPQAHDLAQKWLVETPDDDRFMRASVGTTLMQAQRERYDCEGAPLQAPALHRQFVEGGAHYGTVFHDSVAGLTFFMRGDLDAAEHAYERARRTGTALQGQDSRLAAMPTAMLAALRYERGDLERARSLLREHSFLLADFGFCDHPIARFLTASRLAWIDGQADEAIDALEAGSHVAERHGMQRLQAAVWHERVRQAIADGRSTLAAALMADLERRGVFSSLAPGEAACSTDEMLALAWARVRIDGGDAHAALPVLQRWYQYAAQRRCPQAALRIAVVLARAQAQLGDTGAAQATVAECLLASRQDGFVRSFVDEGAFMATTLLGLRSAAGASDRELRERIDRLLPHFPDASLPADDNTAGGRVGLLEVDPLSARELEILRLTAQGMATSDVSCALGLSATTVKWYWQRIFSKLQVHRRFDAVKLARDHGWVA